MKNQTPATATAEVRDIGGLAKRVTALGDALASLQSAEGWRRPVLILKRLGWTTPAEFIVAAGIVRRDDQRRSS